MLSSAIAGAGPNAKEISELPGTKRSLLDLYLYAIEVPGFLSSKKGHAVFIDVRSAQEVEFQGTPGLCDANIPFEYGHQFTVPWGNTDISSFDKGTPGFAARLQALLTQMKLGKNATIVLIDNHGEISAMAANMLSWHGYSLVYSVVDGYEGDHVANRNVRNNGWLGNRLPIKRASRVPLLPAAQDLE